MSFDPTDEQQQAIDAFLTKENMILEAGAGTGKTSTLKLLSAAMPKRRGLYLAFNKSGAEEAKASFPNNVTCSTVHSLAYRHVVDSNRRFRLNAKRQTRAEVPRLLDVEVEIHRRTLRITHLDAQPRPTNVHHPGAAHGRARLRSDGQRDCIVAAQSGRESRRLRCGVL